jgi:hypothetical protein
LQNFAIFAKQKTCKIAFGITLKRNGGTDGRGVGRRPESFTVPYTVSAVKTETTDQKNKNNNYFFGKKKSLFVI